jgi:hypothetical protein
LVLTLVAGPANAGKVALLLERYLARLDDEPFLIVPNRSDVDRVERDLLARCGCLLAGTIGTFDDLFARIAAGDPGSRAVATDAQRALVLRRAVAGAHLNGLASSARFAGFGDALGQTLAELESGLADPDDVGDDLGGLYAAYLAELERLRSGTATSSAAPRPSACARPRRVARRARLRVRLRGPDRRRVGAARGLAGRADVDVSLPYEPGRAVFASLQRTAEDLSRSPTAA